MIRVNSGTEKDIFTLENGICPLCEVRAGAATPVPGLAPSPLSAPEPAPSPAQSSAAAAEAVPEGAAVPEEAAVLAPGEIDPANDGGPQKLDEHFGWPERRADLLGQTTPLLPTHWTKGWQNLSFRKYIPEELAGGSA